MTAQRRRLLALLDFAQECMRTRAKTHANLAEHSGFLLFDQQAQGLEGAQLAAAPTHGADEIWLSVSPPTPPEMPPSANDPLLAPWLRIGGTLMEPPGLAESIPAPTLGEAGTATVQAGADASVRLADFPRRTEVEQAHGRYLDGSWQPWAQREGQRRKRAQLHVKLFTVYQQLTGTLSENQVELVWGMGLATRGQENARTVTPLVTRQVDIHFEPDTRAVLVRPRVLDAQLELEHLITDSAALAEAEKAAAQYAGSLTAPVSPFVPASYGPLLEIARQALARAGRDDVQISDGWALFARPRSASAAVEDLDRLRTALTELPDEAPLPAAVSAIVSEPDDSAPNPELPAFRGLSAPSGRGESTPRDLFFPKPFNDEQARIAQLLEVSDGVVVQGPPGTGKTHTIANIICHWLATGRSVLVTSMRDPALGVLREHLPPDIRPLALSMLASAQEDMHQFEQAMERVASEVQGLDRAALTNEIARLEQGIDALQTRVARLDVDLGRWAKLNLSRIDLQGQSLDPQDAAAEVMAHAGQYEWIPDPIGIGPQYVPRFTEQDLAGLREARARLGREIEYAGCTLPALGYFPNPMRIVQAHDQLQRYTRMIAEGRDTDVPWLSKANPDTLTAARDIAADIARVKAVREELNEVRLPWGEEVVARIRRGEPAQLFETLDALGAEMEEIAEQRAQFLARPVTVPDYALIDVGFLAALDNLTQGRRPFGLTGMFGKSEARKLLDAVRVSGLPPVTAQDWQHVADYVAMQRKRRELTTRWNVVVPEIGMQAVLATDARGRLSAEVQFAAYARIRKLAREQRAIWQRAMQLFPGWKPVDAEDEEGSLEELHRILEHHLQRHRLGEVSFVVQRARAALEGCSGPIVETMRDFISRSLGNPSLDESTVMALWSQHIATLERLHALSEPLRTVERVTRLIADSGAPKLAKLLAEPGAASDRLLPPTFLRDWRLRRLASHLAAIDSLDELTRLSGVRRTLEQDLVRSYEAVVVKRTWLQLAERMTPTVRAALQAYLNAIQRIGEGDGKRAWRYRQDARFAAHEAYRAVPCWIMPHHRVSEFLPAQLGAFDLVVIDEASQSDLSALPVLLRARKVLIVGDDKQVSPQAIDLQEERIKALIQRHLCEQPALYRAQLSPDRSIYDLAKVVFANSGVMLKEHFRCVAPIIEYSKREFYHHDLRPLRLPRASERIDPPLLDVLISNGRNENGVNQAEIEYIVDEIRRIAADSRLHDRSIGVVSLLGEEQALRIWERLLDELGLEGIRRHDIACGDARMFQGRERHLIFLSMVAAPGNVGEPLAREVFAQQLNVAASRARDQMVLVRSVELEQLPEHDKLRRGLIQHFARPFGDEPRKVSDSRDLCESVLEREIYDWLAGNGYRVMPQVRVGGYRIDLVVEGAQDSRLAIECDGDKHYGPEQWTEDMRRQRALERAGWVFWRCFAASFLRRRNAVLEDLREALIAQGIEPVRSGGWARRRMTETRRMHVPVPSQVVHSVHSHVPRSAASNR